MKILISVLLMLLFVVIPAVSSAISSAIASSSSDTLSMDLDQAINLAMEHSHSAKSMTLTMANAEHNVAAAKGRFGASADLQLVLPRIDESVQKVQVPGELPRYDNRGTREVSAALNLNKPLPTNGVISLAGHIYQQEDSFYDTTIDQTRDQNSFFNSYVINLSQPLFTPNTLKSGLEKAEIGHSLARRAYQRGQLSLSYSVTRVFFQLIKAQGEVEIAREALIRQQENFDLAQRKFDAGLIPEMEALQMEVDLANADNSLLGTESDLTLAIDNFRILVGLPMDQPVTVSSDLTADIFNVDHDQAMAHALEHRTEIFDLQDQIRRSRIIVRETDARSDLQGNISAFYNLTGISDPSDGDANLGDLIDSSWQDLKRRPGNRGVSFSLSIPLWDSGVNEQEVASAEISVRRYEIDQANLERQIVQQVQAALATFEGAKRRLEVLEKSLQIAIRSYDISSRRFESGDITSQVLADNRDRLVQARRSYLDAFVSCRTASADLQLQTLYDFEHGVSLVGGEAN